MGGLPQIKENKEVKFRLDCQYLVRYPPLLIMSSTRFPIESIILSMSSAGNSNSIRFTLSENSSKFSRSIFSSKVYWRSLFFIVLKKFSIGLTLFALGGGTMCPPRSNCPQNTKNEKKNF